MKDDSYINIQGWMINELKLSGNELLAYAIIHGFSHDGESEYCGGRKYMSEALSCSRQTVTTVLSNLEAKGHIRKRVDNIQGVDFNRYSINRGVVKKFDGGSNNQEGIVKKFDGGIVKKFDPCITTNTEINKEIPNTAVIEPKIEPEEKKPEDYPLPRMFKIWMQHFPKYTPSMSLDYTALGTICQIFLKRQPNHIPIAELEEFTKKFAKAVQLHNFYKTKPLKTIANNIQEIIPIFNDPKGYLDELAKPKEKSVLTDVKIVLKEGQVAGYPESKGVKIRL